MINNINNNNTVTKTVLIPAGHRMGGGNVKGFIARAKMGKT